MRTALVAARLAPIGLSVAILCFSAEPQAAGASAAEYVRFGMTEIAEGGLLDWSADGSSIYYDHLEADGDFDVWRMNADGRGQICVTCDHPQLPNRDQGNPVLHPGGRYLVFQAEQASHEAIGPFFTEPGIGRFNDLWALDLQTSQAFQLTSVASSGWAGTLQPQFNGDGSKLLWSQLEGQGTGGLNDWALMVADFDSSPTVGLSNIATYNPGPSPGWLLVHGWGPDDNWIYFTCTPLPGMTDSYMDTCRMDFDSPTQVTRLNFTSGTDGEAAEWEDHSQLSPAGDVYAYISSEPYSVSPDAATALFTVKTDLWLMNADGSGPQRITYFNEPGHPDYLGVRAIASEMRWSPDGTRVALRLQTPTLAVRNHIYVVELSRDVDDDGVPDAGDTSDTDSDGLRDQAEHFCGSDPGSPVGWPERIDPPFVSLDDDGDTSFDEVLPPGSSAYDCDGDGYSGTVESHAFGSTSRGDQDACGTTAWPADFVPGGVPDGTNRVTVSDLASYLAPIRHLNTSPTEGGYDQRWDIVPGAGAFSKAININDLASLIVVAPRMLGGARAFNGPVCPW